MLTGNSLNSTSEAAADDFPTVRGGLRAGVSQLPGYRFLGSREQPNLRIVSVSQASRKLTPPPLRTRSSRLAIALRRWIGHNTSGSMPKIFRVLIWTGVAALGAFALATIALRRGEQINAMWLVVAALWTDWLGYRSCC